MSEDSARGKVLLVDDDPEIMGSVGMALKSRGYSVVMACDGNQALSMTETDNPDVMVLDMMLPKRSGLGVLEKMRNEHNRRLPIIMITASEGSNAKAKAQTLGVTDFIRKPFSMQRLLESVERSMPKPSAGPKTASNSNDVVRLQCPSCNARIKAPKQLLGQTRKCPGCRGDIFIELGPLDDEGPMLVLD